MIDDDFSWLPDALVAAGRPTGDHLPVARRSFPSTDGRRLGALQWGTGDPEIVLLHGGGQNAHTWDMVAALLGRPCIAFDLPGHGHSSWRDDRDYSGQANATAVAAVLFQLGTSPVVVAGMSLGGLTTITLAATRPELVRSIVIVDIAPRDARTNEEVSVGEQGQVALMHEPSEFTDLDTMVDRVVALSPNRPREVLRRGVLHNSIELPDGTRRWRYDDLHRVAEYHSTDGSTQWDELGSLRMPVTLVLGGDSAFVSHRDLEEFRRRQPLARVATVAGAGHAVQSDRPLELVALLRDIV